MIDTDTLILETAYTLDSAWWDEARSVVEALLAGQAPPLCKIKPWSTFATYMALNADPVAGFNAANATLPADQQRALGAVVSQLAQPQPTTQTTAGGKQSRPTDDELRDRWMARNPNAVYGMGSWRVYENGIWSAVADALIEQELLDVIEDAKPEGIRPGESVLRSVGKLARVKLFYPADLWDADPDLLVCANGMLHIPTLTLRPHNRHAYQTSGVAYAYDPQADCPYFLQALSRLPFAVQQFLQEYAGYVLTTDTKHEIAVWFLGIPGSGKSTIIEGFNAMLGSRAGVLSLHQVATSRFALTNIAGKTLLYAFENRGQYLEATDVLNAMISGEMIEVERKFHDPALIIPRAKLLWAMNELPRISDAGNGIFRRACIVQFDPLPTTQKDENVKEEIKLEGQGILNWALIGLQRLTKRGKFDIPDEVKQATEQFQEGNDPESAFVIECCERGLLVREQSSALYTAYHQWCIDNGHKPKSSTSVANDWRRLGFTRTRSNSQTLWNGVKLLP